MSRKNSIRKRPFSARKNAKVQKSARGIFGQKNAHMRIRVRARGRFWKRVRFSKSENPWAGFSRIQVFFTSRFYAFQFFLVRFGKLNFVFRKRTWLLKNFFFWSNFFSLPPTNPKGLPAFWPPPAFFWPRSLRTRAFFWPKMPRALFCTFAFFRAENGLFRIEFFQAAFFVFQLRCSKIEKSAHLTAPRNRKKWTLDFGFAHSILVFQTHFCSKSERLTELKHPKKVNAWRRIFNWFSIDGPSQYPCRCNWKRIGKCWKSERLILVFKTRNVKNH